MKRAKKNIFQRWKSAFQSAFSNGYQIGDVINSILAPLIDADNQSRFEYLQDGTFSVINKVTGVGDDGSTSEILGNVQSIADNSRQEYLEDREHTEQREDTAFQRQVEDMRKAGLNPYTISASPVNSSSSSVGSNNVMTQLQTLGYILDLKNLSYTNKSIINKLLGTIITSVAK